MQGREGETMVNENSEADTQARPALPLRWKLVRLGDLCTLNYGASLPAHSRKPGDVLVYGSNGPVGQHDQKLTRGKTIIIGRKGSIGEIHLSPVGCWPIDTTYYVEEASTAAADIQWLTCLLSWLDLKNLNKAAAIPGLSREDVYRLTVPLPPREEQARMAARLYEEIACVEEAREAAQHQLKAIDALPTACLRGAFLNHTPLTIEAHPQPAPDGWKWMLLSDLTRLESGHTPSRSRPDWWGGDIPWLALPDIRRVDGQTVLETTENTNEHGIANSSARVLPVGTVCLSRTASVGFVTKLGRPMATSQDFVNWVCGPRILPDYLLYVLLGARKYLHSLAEGAIHKTIYVPAVKQFQVLLPPIDVQAQIVERLQSQRKSIEVARQAAHDQLQVLEAMPARLLARAFSGQWSREEEELRIHVAAWIVRRMMVGAYIGRTILVKMMFLAEAFARVPLNGRFHRDRYGPYDNKLVTQVEQGFADHGWFRVEHDIKGATHYRPDASFSDLTSLSAPCQGEALERLEKLVKLLKGQSTDVVEMIGTIYGAWNDLLVAGQEVSFEAIYAQVQPDNWHPNKMERPKSMWRHWYRWLKEQGITPDGAGPVTKSNTPESDTPEAASEEALA